MSFQQTVNLKDKMEKEKQERLQAQSRVVMPREYTARPVTDKEAQAKKTEDAKNRAEAVDKVFGDAEEKSRRQEMQKISRPDAPKFNLMSGMLKNIIIIVLILAVGFGAFYMLKNRTKAPVVVAEPKWYAVTLVNGDLFYGKITATSSDPIELSNVYYDYDQMNKNATSTNSAIPPKKDSTSLRLVKRGKESYGPSGTMSVFRTQILYIEPMKDDSKVLKAILENEK